MKRGRRPDVRSKEAGERFENARYIFAPSYEKLIEDRRWEKIVDYYEVKDIRAWKKKGIPLKRLPELSKFFRVPLYYFDDPDISVDHFKKAVELKMENPDADLSALSIHSGREWEACKLCGRNTRNLFTCGECDSSGICMESCYDPGEKSCIKCSRRLSINNKNIENFIELNNPDSTFEAELGSKYTEEGKRKPKRDIHIMPKKQFYHYKTGDRVNVWFTCSSDAYVYLINIGPTGNISMLLPNKYTDLNRVEDGEVIQFPDESQEWTLSEPIGPETIKLFATKNKMELLDSWLKEVFDPVFLKIDKSRIGVLTQAFEELPAGEWAEATTVLNQKRTDI